MKASAKYALIILVLIGLVSAVYLTFIYTPRCESFACFQVKMQECKRAVYLNDEKEATWRYEVKGKTNGECQVDVLLLQAKEGELGVDKLAGYEMVCNYPQGVGTYPQKDLAKCHGRLKEEFQAIIIKKLHTHILNNLGKINEELNKVV